MSSNSGNGRFMIDGYEVVDLGLPSGLLFATCNVGATKETNYGNYYMYGKGSRSYNSSDRMYGGIEEPLNSSFDTARQFMGSEWRMPTMDELIELKNNTDYEWVTNFNESGINGGKYTSKTNPNAYVFFPAAGIYARGSLETEGKQSFIWSSWPSPNGNEELATALISRSSAVVSISPRNRGLSVRGVTLGGR